MVVVVVMGCSLAMVWWCGGGVVWYGFAYMCGSIVSVACQKKSPENAKHTLSELCGGR